MAYSKSKVDKAGRLLADRLQAIARGKKTGPGPVELLEAIQVIEWWREEHAKPLSRVAANLRYYAAQEGKPVVAQRLKKLPTIVGKLVRVPKMKLARMGNIGGVRAVLPTQEAAYNVAARLRRNWTITGGNDHVAKPKPDGYRALHLINRNRGRLIEIQLRTPRQDTWANTVEAFSRSVAPGLKFGGGPDFVREYFIAVAEGFAAEDQGIEVDLALRARIDELYGQADTFVERVERERERESDEPTDEIKHFLVIYDPATGEAAVKRFGTDYDAAQAAYAEAEQASGMETELDIVLLSADSLETIKQTHSSYFNGGNNRLEELLPS